MVIERAVDEDAQKRSAPPSARPAIPPHRVNAQTISATRGLRQPDHAGVWPHDFGTHPGQAGLYATIDDSFNGVFAWGI